MDVVFYTFKKTIFYIFLTFGQFHEKREFIGQKQNNFSLQGEPFDLHPYFEHIEWKFEPQSRFPID